MKNKFYNEPYFNRIAWILENIQHSQLTSIEALTVIQLEHMRINHISIDLDNLARRCKVEPELIDLILESLSAKGYLSIEVNPTEIGYDLDALYETPLITESDSDTVFKLFEKEFGRPLSSSEIDKLVDWTNRTSSEFCIHALREAVMYRKLSFGYIDKILSQWVKTGVTLQQLNEGRHNDEGND